MSLARMETYLAARDKTTQYGGSDQKEQLKRSFANLMNDYARRVGFGVGSLAYL